MSIIKYVGRHFFDLENQFSKSVSPMKYKFWQQKNDKLWSAKGLLKGEALPPSKSRHILLMAIVAQKWRPTYSNLFANLANLAFLCQILMMEGLYNEDLCRHISLSVSLSLYGYLFLKNNSSESCIQYGAQRISISRCFGLGDCC